MKRLIFLLTMSFTTAIVFAQDIIIKRDATKIEAVILEVSENEIRYKNFKNQSGPTFVISTDDISSVIYINGDVQVFEKQSAPTTRNDNIRSSTTRNDNKYNNFRADGIMSYMDGRYYLNDQVLTENEFKDYLYKNCMPAYAYYKKQLAIGNSGLILLSIGAGVLIGGGLAYEKTDVTSGFWCMVMSTVPIGLGIPLCAAGFANRKKACKVYNARCSNAAYNCNTEVRLIFQKSTDGLGIALCF